MQRLLFLAAVGFAAQLVDGSLGMAYGLTASSLLLAIGLAPAAASASVHMAEVLTTVISGLAHWRAGNVNRDVVLRLALPGAAGAFAGALFLPFLPSAVARLPVSAVLIALGFYVLARHVRAVPPVLGAPVRVNGRGLALLGLLGGFCDAVAGGGWGPVVASTLLARAYLDPRRAVGSANASEFGVAAAATAGFALSLGWQGIRLPWVGAIVLGGAVAAPLAARLVGRIPQRFLGSLVGGAILVTNTRNLLAAVTLAGWPAVVGYGACALLLGVVLLAILVRAVARGRTAASGGGTEPSSA